MSPPPEPLVRHIQQEYALRGTAISMERAEAIAAIRLARKPPPMIERVGVVERRRYLDALHDEEERLTAHLGGEKGGGVAQEEEAALGGNGGLTLPARARRVVESKPPAAVLLPTQAKLF